LVELLSSLRRLPAKSEEVLDTVYDFFKLGEMSATTQILCADKIKYDFLHHALVRKVLDAVSDHPSVKQIERVCKCLTLIGVNVGSDMLPFLEVVKLLNQLDTEELKAETSSFEEKEKTDLHLLDLKTEMWHFLELTRRVVAPIEKSDITSKEKYFMKPFLSH